MVPVYFDASSVTQLGDPEVQQIPVANNDKQFVHSHREVEAFVTAVTTTDSRYAQPDERSCL